jgi:hypothetical protein
MLLQHIELESTPQLKKILIQKKITEYNYGKEEYFVDLLKELKNKTTIFASLPINCTDQDLFLSASHRFENGSHELSTPG